VDIADLKEILRILEAQDITEFELEQDGVKLRVCRAPVGAPAGAAALAATVVTAAPAVAAGSAAPAVAPAAPEPVAAPAEPAANGTLLKSPIVGRSCASSRR
jgi:biotin carboxyl carrier protein